MFELRILSWFAGRQASLIELGAAIVSNSETALLLQFIGFLAVIILWS